MSPLGGRGSCGLEHPFKVSATANGTVAVTPPATIGCPMTASVDRWMARSVQPAARAYFGSRVVEIRQIASYGCRTRNSRGAAMSEHAFGNALDVAAFRLADGREVNVFAIGGEGLRRRGPSSRRPLPGLAPSSTRCSARAATPTTPTTSTSICSAPTRGTAATIASQAPMAAPQSPNFRTATASGAVAKTPLSFTGTGREAY